MIKDILCNSVNVGDYIVYPGGGNTSCEYSYIFGQVTRITDKRVTVRRMTIRYDPVKTVDYKSASVAHNKVIKVTSPHPGMLKVYNDIQNHKDIVGLWLHGKKSIDWDKV